MTNGTTALALSARDRILETAGALFARKGVWSVAMDDVLAAANISRTTLYRYFPSRDVLVAEYLRRLDEPSRQSLIKGATARASRGAEAILAVFDTLDAWFNQPDFCGCPFTKMSIAFADMPNHPVRRAVLAHKDAIRSWLEKRCKECGVSSSEDVADDLMLILEGAITTFAVRREPSVANRARGIAATLLESRAAQHTSALTCATGSAA